MYEELKDRVAIVTGANAGIGLETVRQFLAEGVRVVAGDLETGTLVEEAAHNDRLVPVQADMRVPEAATLLADTAISRFGQIDILFNNAGVASAREGFMQIADADWQATFGLNLMGYVRMARAVIPYMLARRKGVIVHCGSETGRIPHMLLPDYSVSKAAVLMLSKVLSLEFTGEGIRSNVVAPAHVRTTLWDRPGGFLDSLAEKFGTGREEAVEVFLKNANIPSGRLGKPEDVAAAVLFLVSDRADFVSGVELAVNGGVTRFV
ncbi:SDR family NAD(P)-dependent oxidoreductase [Paraburkholderia terrae]|uniref:Short-chain dehydrogenase n=1 Tax=Paraburkholderia terrae TaxID=311230 RepID=A0ABM7U2T2_9BURK|nr:SDR family oxidoreductase [Paraburkholderia terrae]BCZ85595.1 short-chain dehydrogenase [Paraburkholderia terrae]BDC45949.1 short-chain dehydrogenase [Paraburkholderia terrae]